MVNPGVDRAPDLADHKLRLIVHSSVGGSQTRISLSNGFGRVKEDFTAVASLFSFS